jgi:ribonuclease P protein component
VASRSFVLLLSEQREATGDGLARLGITVSRRVGNAVVRARVKRQIREWFRRNRDRAPMRRDIVVIARPTAASLPSSEFDDELGGALRRVAQAKTP